MLFIMWCGRWQWIIHVPRIFGFKFHHSRLRHAHQHRIHRVPGCFRGAPAFRSRYHKLMPVEDEWGGDPFRDLRIANAPGSQSHDQWSCRWRRHSVEC